MIIPKLGSSGDRLADLAGRFFVSGYPQGMPGLTPIASTLQSLGDQTPANPQDSAEAISNYLDAQDTLHEPDPRRNRTGKLLGAAALGAATGGLLTAGKSIPAAARFGESDARTYPMLAAAVGTGALVGAGVSTLSQYVHSRTAPARRAAALQTLRGSPGWISRFVKDPAIRRAGRDYGEARQYPLQGGEALGLLGGLAAGSYGALGGQDAPSALQGGLKWGFGGALAGVAAGALLGHLLARSRRKDLLHTIVNRAPHV